MGVCRTGVVLDAMELKKSRASFVIRPDSLSERTVSGRAEYIEKIWRNAARISLVDFVLALMLMTNRLKLLIKV